MRRGAIAIRRYWVAVFLVLGTMARGQKPVPSPTSLGEIAKQAQALERAYGTGERSKLVQIAESLSGRASKFLVTLEGRLKEQTLRNLARAIRQESARVPRDSVLAYSSLIDDRVLRPIAVRRGGPAALRLCRTGREEGLPLLRRINAIYEDAPWSLGNLGLALRFLGRYEEALACYQRLLRETGPKAWVLNDMGLCLQATGRYGEAMTAYRRGIQDSSAPRSRDTCRSNLAILLLRRNEVGDRREARALLRLATRRDPTRTRARYWLLRSAGKPRGAGR